MGDALYRFFLAVGIGLGLIAGQPDPAISAKVLRQDQGPGREVLLVAEVRVDAAFSPGARELVESGSTVALRVVARLVARDGRVRECSATRSLAWDPHDRRFQVSLSDGRRSLSFSDLEAAVVLASEFPDLAICPASTLAEGGKVTIAATVGLIDSSGSWHDAPVLWNYVRPEAGFSFASPTEVPF